MRQAMNFRFSPKTIVILHQLEEKLILSKTTILEEALQFYAKKKLSPNQPLLRFAGKLKGKEADRIIKSIKLNRKNKNKDIAI